jgi:hypothetical protein
VSPADAHARAEVLLADALRAPDPAAALARAARDPSLPAEVRAALGAADADGVRLGALLVAKLRFERLLRGSVRAAEAFATDPAAFAAAFRRWHEAHPPIAFWPAEEGRAWEQRERGAPGASAIL